MAVRSFVLAASAVLTLSSVAAHQAVEVPKPNWTLPKKATYWAPLSFLEKNGVKTSASVDGFMKEKGYSTLRALMDDSKLYKVNSNADNFLCGYTDPTKGSQVIPKDSTMRTTGYTHVGPCEVWIDNVRVIAGDNCHEQVSNTTKVDYSNCKGSCTMRWYWLGLRYLKKKWSWQVYKNCIALTGDGPTISKGVTTTYLKAPQGIFAGKAAAPATGSTPTTTTKAPATTTKAPATAPKPTTKAPTKDTVGGEGDEYATTPKPTTKAPATTPAATPKATSTPTSKPAASTPDPVKCKFPILHISSALSHPSAVISKTLATAVAHSSAALLFFQATTTAVEAHQLVLIPKPTYIIKGKQNQWNPLAFLEDQGFPTTANFNAYLTANKYTSLRAFMNNSTLYTVNASANFGCGFTKLDGERQPIPTNGQMRLTGYTHDGPCEIWMNDTKVFAGENCHTELPSISYSMDYSACKGSCTLRWYWMGIRYVKNEYSWQVYKACTPLDSEPSSSSAGVGAEGSCGDASTSASASTSSSSASSSSVSIATTETSASGSIGSTSTDDSTTTSSSTSADVTASSIETSASGSSSVLTSAATTVTSAPAKCRTKKTSTK